MAIGVEFFVDSGANIHSEHKELHTWDELGMSEEEWNEMSEDEQYKMAEEWAANYLSIGFRIK